MSVSDQRTAAGDLCGKWMPRKQTHCVRGAGHPPPCKSPDAMKRQRERSAASRPSRVVTPADRARWKRAHKFVRLGITEERFNELLEAQAYACAMCRQAFGETRLTRPQVDHDHNCCKPKPKGDPRSCGECIRGLLCFRCNTALGYIEKWGELAKTYLAQFEQVCRDESVTHPAPGP